MLVSVYVADCVLGSLSVPSCDSVFPMVKCGGAVVPLFG